MMGKVKGLECPRCFKMYGEGPFQCVLCQVVLEVILDLSNLGNEQLHEIRRRRDPTIWKWWEFYPIEDRSKVVSLGEGYTPLLRSERLSAEVGIDRLYLKNDTLLPTGSLKDRSNAVGLSKARELGAKVAAVASTGNAAASVAAYAAAAGLSCVVLVPEGTAPAKLVQAASYGAAVVEVRGDYDQVARLYRRAVEAFGWYDCLSTNPYRNEGKKSYAYELFDQLDGEVPDWIIHPTAGGLGVFAIWKGYHELFKLGGVHRLPKLVAAQAEAAAPIVAAFERGVEEIEPVVPRETVAESIKVGYPKSMGWRALKVMRESGGTAIALSDEELLNAQALLGRLAGLFAEPAGAASLAAALKLRKEGVIAQGDLVVCTITGHGLKQPEAVISRLNRSPIEPDMETLKRRLGSLTPFGTFCLDRSQAGA